jgi:hypothetical protein
MACLRFIQPFYFELLKCFRSASVRRVAPIKPQICKGIPMYERNLIFEWLVCPVVWQFCFRYLLKLVFVSRFQFNPNQLLHWLQEASLWMTLRKICIPNEFLREIKGDLFIYWVCLLTRCVRVSLDPTQAVGLVHTRFSNFEGWNIFTQKLISFSPSMVNRQRHLTIFSYFAPKRHQVLRQL